MAEVEKKNEAKEEKKKNPKSDKPSLWTKISNFFKGYRSECKKIVWYGKTQTIKSTALVIVCLVVVSAVISLIDLGLSRAILWLGSLV